MVFLHCILILMEASAGGTLMSLEARQVRVTPLWYRSRLAIARSLITFSASEVPSLKVDVSKESSIKTELSRHQVTLARGRPRVDTHRSLRESPSVYGPISVTAKRIGIGLWEKYHHIITFKLIL